jgi:hypothetical protein
MASPRNTAAQLLFSASSPTVELLSLNTSRDRLLIAKLILSALSMSLSMIVNPKKGSDFLQS